MSVFLARALAEGLAGGAQGYVQGRMLRDRRAQDERRLALQEAEAQRVADYQRRAQALAEAADARAAQQQQITFDQAGYSRVQPDSVRSDFAEGGDVLDTAQVPALAGAGTALRAFGRQAAQQQAASTGGYAKTGPSMAERAARAAEAVRRQQQREANDATLTRDTRIAEREDFRDRRNFDQQKELERMRAGNARALVDARRTPAPDDDGPLGPDGQPITPGMRAKAAQSARTMTDIRGSIASYRQMLDEAGPRLMVGNDPVAARLSSAYTNLLMQLKEANNLGVLNGRDLEVLQKQIPPPTGPKSTLWRGKGALLSSLDQVGSDFARQDSTLRRTYGLPMPPNGDTVQRQAVPAIKDRFPGLRIP
jgi:hypothetical protein